MSQEIEDLIRQSGLPQDPGLRGRVLGAVQVELRQAPTSRRWRNRAALAAMVVLWIHATWSASLRVRIDSPEASAMELSRAAEQIRGLVPELSDSESRRMALRALAGARRPRWGLSSADLKR